MPASLSQVPHDSRLAHLPFRMMKSGIAKYILRIRMIALFIAAVGVMILHHFFCRYLNRKPVNYAFFGNPSFSAFIRDYYGSIGNALSIISKAALCSALAIVFVQIFWYQHNRRKYSVGQIDRAVLCKDDPLASLITFRSTTVLSTITFLGVAMVVITIFAPGALKPESTSIPRDCFVPTLDFSVVSLAVTDNNNTYSGPISQVRGFVGSIVLSGTYSPPFVNRDLYGASTTYNIGFTAPAMNCTNITSTFNFTRDLPLPSFTPGQAIDVPVMVWNGTGHISSDGLVTLTMASRKLIPLLDGYYSVTPDLFPSAASCVPYISAYNVSVTTGSGDGSIPYTKVNSIDFQTPLQPWSTDYVEVNYDAIVDSLFNLMNGTALYNPSTFDFGANSASIIYSPIGAGNSDSPWSFNVDIVDAIPSLMQNVSISILSDKLSQSGDPTLTSVPSTCHDANVYYIYHPIRLFLSYGAGLLVTAFCIGLGFLVIRSNGAEEYLVFSRILHTLPGDELSPSDEKRPNSMYFS